MHHESLPNTPLYSPTPEIKLFRQDEDIKNIKKRILATPNTYYEDKKFKFKGLSSDKEWVRPWNVCEYPIFIRDGKLSKFDALQGDLGNCWMMSSIEAATLNKELIKFVVPQNQSFYHEYVGAFHFRLWSLGTWYDVVVDDFLPVYRGKRNLCYGHSASGDVFWGALLEKAYIKFWSVNEYTDYKDIATGMCLTAMQNLTGGIVETKTQDDIFEVFVLKWLMDNLAKNEALMCCDFVDNVEKYHVGLWTNHNYAVTKVIKFPDNHFRHPGLFLLRLFNTTGFGEFKGPWSDDDVHRWRNLYEDLLYELKFVPGQDGEFHMEGQDFKRYFRQVYICHLGPGRFIAARAHITSKAVDYWHTMSFSGEWVKGISAVGSERAARHQNPQYFVKLDWVESDKNRDQPGDVVIDLVQKSKAGRRIRPLLGIYVYANPPQIPLNRNDMENLKPVFEPGFTKQDKRSVSTSLNLEPGTYCIIPCTYAYLDSSLFLLRVFSEYSVRAEGRAGLLSKSPPVEEEASDDFDEGLKQLFYDTVKDHDEIDWITLKTILEKKESLQKGNTQDSSYGIFSSIFKFLKNIFVKIIPFRSTRSSETSDLIFTKDQCRSMVAMVDDNHSGTLSFQEFIKLFKTISFWTKVYEEYMDETLGYLKVVLLRDALSAVGFNIDQRTSHTLSYIYADEHGVILLPDFIVCGVALETAINLSKQEDGSVKDSFTLTLEECVKSTLNL